MSEIEPQVMTEVREEVEEEEEPQREDEYYNEEFEVKAISSPYYVHCY